MPSDDHSGWTMEIPGPPATVRASPGEPSAAIGATRRRVASHGMSGWSHSSQASSEPSGEGRGAATKSGPETSTRPPPPAVAASGIETTSLRTADGRSSTASCVSRTA